MFYVQTVSPLHLFCCTKKETRNIKAVLRKALGALECRYVFGQKRWATQLWAALAKAVKSRSKSGLQWHTRTPTCMLVLV